MTGAKVALAALLAAAAPPVAGSPILEVEVPGSLLDAAVVPHGAPEGPAIVLLLRTEDGPGGEASRDLYLLDPRGSAAARPERLLAGLPEGATLLAGRHGAGSGGLPTVLAARVGRLEVLDPSPDAGSAPVLSLPLPRRAERTARGLRLTSPAVQPLAGSGPVGEVPPCFATEPEAHGRRRLRVLLLCPGREEAEEVWARLPGADTVTESRVLRLGGVPVVALLTRETLGVFVKQDVRVFPLAASRTRVGSTPLLAARTDCPLWRSSELTAADADGDGRDDLVLLCEKGLIDPELRVEVFRNLASPGEAPRFERRSRAVNLEGEHDRWRYEDDLTGDGLPDLLSLRDGRFLELRSGSRGRRPVDGRPLWSVTAGSSAELTGEGEDEDQVEVRAGRGGGAVRVSRGGPRILGVADVDGDGAREVVLYRTVRKRQGEETVWRGGLVTVLRLP